MKKDILHSAGQLDCLSYYKKVFPKMKKFLGNREIATKIYIGKNIDFIVKRGSKDPALFVNDLKISDKFMKLRKAEDLGDVRAKLTQKEILIWHYFVPRKLIEMHYACNGEGVGKPINRIFIDVDKGDKISYENYLEIVRELIKTVKLDNELKKLIKFKIFAVWTGKSFHVYLLLNKEVSHDFYERYLSFNENTFTSKWAGVISKKTGIEVQAHHERVKDEVILDTSATPSGKLTRCPYSLHISKQGELNGVSVPIKERDLFRKDIIEELLSLTPEKVVRNF
jgi:hypothetical protein